MCSDLFYEDQCGGGNRWLRPEVGRTVKRLFSEPRGKTVKKW